MQMEDLAFISDLCRSQGFDQELRSKFVKAIKPFMTEYCESGAFKKKDQAVIISARLAIAVASVNKYAEDEPELWSKLVEMLNWSLSEQVGESKLIPMGMHEFLSLVLCLSRRRESDAQLWGHLAKVLVTAMNTKKLGLNDLMLATRALVNAKVRSDKLYSFIIRYFAYLGFSETAQASLDANIPIFFFFSLAKAYPTLSDSEDFFKVINTYLQSKMPNLTERQCEVCLDTWKHNGAFINDDTKNQLVERKLLLSVASSREEN
jgi:hypothetical protein